MKRFFPEVIFAILGIAGVIPVNTLRVQMHLPLPFRHETSTQHQYALLENQLQDKSNVLEDNHNTEIQRQSNKVAPMEDLAQKAHGEREEKWKTLGYSETTGYPIIDLSDLGIDSKKTQQQSNGQIIDEEINKDKSTNLLQSTSVGSNQNDQDIKSRPLSYSEMKGLGLKKNNYLKFDKQRNTAWSNSNHKMLRKYYSGSTNQDADNVVQKLHTQLHRTNRHETIRSILYPQSNPAKYRISSKSKRMEDFFHVRLRPKSKGKYDIRQLDVEKLLDIIIPDAVALTYKYVRDLPSVPVIYDCKMGIVFPLFKIIGGFHQLHKFYDNRLTIVENGIRSDWFLQLFKILFRWLLGINPRTTTAEGIARAVEHDLTMFAMELPEWTDKECEGEMDQQDWDNFYFHYNYMITQGQLAKGRRQTS